MLRHDARPLLAAGRIRPGRNQALLARDKPLAAARLIRSLRRRIGETVALYPEVGETCENLVPGLRRFPIGNYVVFYRIRDRVEIVRILHGARDIEAFFAAEEG